MGAVSPNCIDMTRDDETEYLLASPQGTRFQYGWLGYFAIPRGKKHKQVHHLTLEGIFWTQIQENYAGDDIQRQKWPLRMGGIGSIARAQRLKHYRKVGQPHPLKEDVPLGKLAHGSEGVLHNTHDRPVGLRCDNHPGHHGQLLDLCPRLQ